MRMTGFLYKHYKLIPKGDRIAEAKNKAQMYRLFAQMNEKISVKMTQQELYDIIKQNTLNLFPDLKGKKYYLKSNYT